MRHTSKDRVRRLEREKGNMKRERIDERLGDRLDAERRRGVASMVQMTLEARERQSEPIRTGLRQLWNVGGDGSEDPADTL